MGTKSKSKIQGLEFLPLILIVIYKIVIQNLDVGHQVKMIILYVFIGISTLVFGYLLFDKRRSGNVSKTSAILLFALIFVICILFYLKK